jgi:hypothetical protein
LRVDFELRAEQAYHASVRRTIHLGLDDLRIEVDTCLNDSGELEVIERMTNRSDRPVSFGCSLFAPGRRRMTAQITGLGRGCETRVFQFANGKELLGRPLLLQAQEVGGPRVLNYRFVAEE